MKIETLPTAKLVANPFRDTWEPSNQRAPKAFADLVESLKRRAAIHTLPIHVALIVDRYTSGPGSSKYIVLDGHVALDIYRAFGRKEVEAIVHPEITMEQEAIEFYIAANYLRSSGWLRSGVKLRNNLASIGVDRAMMLMPDVALAADLVRRSEEQWEKYSTVFIDPNEKENHEDSLFFG